MMAFLSNRRSLLISLSLSLSSSSRPLHVCLRTLCGISVAYSEVCADPKLRKSRRRTPVKDLASFDTSVAKSILSRMKELSFACPAMNTLIENKDPSFLTLWSNLEFLLAKGMKLEKAMELLGRPNHRRFLVDTPTARFESFFEFLAGLGVPCSDACKVFLFEPCLTTQSLPLLERKVCVFEEFGVARVHLRNVILSSPHLFSMSAATIRARLGFLRDYGIDDGHAMRMLLSYNSVVLTRSLDNLRTTLCAFESAGVTRKRICSYIKRYNSYFRLSKQVIAQKEDFLATLGLKKDTAVMFTAQMVLIGLRSELIQQRLDHLIALGFSQNQAFQMVQRFPQILLHKEEPMDRAFHYLVNSYQCSFEDMVKYPYIFSLSYDMRLKPRLHYLNELKRRGLVDDLSAGSVLNLSDQVFFRRYVKKFEKQVAADKPLQELLLSTWTDTPIQKLT